MERPRVDRDKKKGMMGKKGGRRMYDDGAEESYGQIVFEVLRTSVEPQFGGDFPDGSDEHSKLQLEKSVGSTRRTHDTAPAPSCDGTLTCSSTPLQTGDEIVQEGPKVNTTECAAAGDSVDTQRFSPQTQKLWEEYGQLTPEGRTMKKHRLEQRIQEKQDQAGYLEEAKHTIRNPVAVAVLDDKIVNARIEFGFLEKQLHVAERWDSFNQHRQRGRGTRGDYAGLAESLREMLSQLHLERYESAFTAARLCKTTDVSELLSSRLPPEELPVKMPIAARRKLAAHLGFAVVKQEQGPQPLLDDKQKGAHEHVRNVRMSKTGRAHDTAPATATRKCFTAPNKRRQGRRRCSEPAISVAAAAETTIILRRSASDACVPWGLRVEEATMKVTGYTRGSVAAENSSQAGPS
eukprot:gene57700-biopygen89431